MNIKIFAAIAVSAIMLTACGEKIPETPPAVQVTADGAQVANIVNETCWDNTVYIMDGTAADWLEQYGDPVYYPDGTTFEVALPEKNTAPDSVDLTDSVICEDGSYKYDIRAAVREIIPHINENVISFTLDGHPASMLSSQLSDYESGAVLRCFELTCKWGDNECVYTFCIRSDAGVGEYSESNVSNE